MDFGGYTRWVALLVCATAFLEAATTAVCTDGCDFPMTAAGLNAAIEAAACGDTITLEAGATITIESPRDIILIYKACPPGNELVITTDSDPSWLPGDGMRIIPAYLPLLPLIHLNGPTNGDAAIKMDGPLPAVSGVILRGIAIKSSMRAGTEPYTLIKVGPPYPRAPEELADNITLDRVYITGDLDPDNRIVKAVHVNGSNFLLANSFFDDLHRGPGQEGYAVYMANEAIGPFTFTNNYTGSGISSPFFVGGAGGPNFTQGEPHPDGLLVEHNHFHNSLKWYSGTPDYVGDRNRPCIKNLSEMKTGSNAVFRWNTGDNSFNGCASQWFGFVFTIRNIAWKQGGRASLSTSRDVVTVANYSSGSALVEPAVGHLIGVALLPSVADYPAGGQFEFRRIVTADNVNRVYKVDSPFSSAPLASNAEWALVTIPWGRIHNIEVYGNYFRNVATPLLTLGVDDIQEGGVLKGLSFRHNLVVNDSPYMMNGGDSGNSFQQTLAKIVNAGEDITLENNSYVIQSTAHRDAAVNTAILHQEQNDPAFRNVTKAFKFRNNLAPAGLYGIAGSGVSVADLWNTKNDGSLEFRNNTVILPSAVRSQYERCNPPRICSGNFFLNDPAGMSYSPAFVNPARNDFSLSNTSPFKRKGYNDSDLGANMAEVAIIRNLEIKPGPRWLFFRWQVTPVIREMACSLEVSPDRGLISDTSTYTLVNALRPDYYKRANFDAANFLATISDDRLERSFTVGDEISLTDDNGVVRDLALETDTTYYYRLMCGGATERGSVRTMAAP